MPTPFPPAAAGAGGGAVVLLVLLATVPVLAGTRLVLTRLPEPAEPDGKIRYADLATQRFVLTCTVLAALGACLVALTAPSTTWPLWWVLCAPALVLVAVDAETTWLPLPLTHLVWAAASGGALLAAVLGGGAVLGRSLAGAAATGLLYLLVWRLSGRALGFGDVRLAPVLGAATASVGWSLLFAALVLGSLAGAGVGIVRTLRGQRGAFAYAPSMLAGAFLACGTRLLSG